MNVIIVRPKSKQRTTYLQNRVFEVVRPTVRDNQKDLFVKSVEWCFAAFGRNLFCCVNTECFDVVRKNLFCGFGRSIEMVASQPHTVDSIFNEIILVSN